ncbi:uncharacterized protein I303_108369 [Kwoniella dejecticola CBS 10117]|uniref:Solute carrier family 35 (UDP-xylose/UDP-N-acetylglucosamine transporter), member B4 n=1 Tax=Kwoniella dejecticola CBS 10117 TaxID=1296121 RepID=A0A1A5ZXL4_9TREE|nr:uncharacterized protein I303_07304 [Kwoniella dejecticola CBS 10117]OBR82544.1 hypothetical protein I303_07304 [Kwoniella dejecticola CBS 10117]
MVDRSLVSSIVQSSIGEWGLILALVFGGCCSNVWALEGVLRDYPKSGTFLTFVQFLYITITTISSQVIWYRIPKTQIPYPALKKRQVPLGRWAVQVVLFLAISLMNNYAFGLKIPVTVHIIFRSGGLCVSMLVGRVFGKRSYSYGQVLSALLITSGIVIATISAPKPPRPPRTQADPSHPPIGSTTSWLPEHLQFFAGVGLLTLAMILSAFLGLWQEQTYNKYGKQWREALFYGHALSLPFFIPLQSSIRTTYTSFASSPPISLHSLTRSLALPVPVISSFPIPTFDPKSLLGGYADLLIPSALLGLAINIVTQGICVRGVNRLTSKVNSVTVNLILTIRKAVSLGISVWWFQTGYNAGLAAGGIMVLLGTILYSVAPGTKGLPYHPAEVDSKAEKPNNGRNLELREQTAKSQSTGMTSATDARSGVRSRKSRIAVE